MAVAPFFCAFAKTFATINTRIPGNFVLSKKQFRKSHLRSNPFAAR